MIPHRADAAGRPYRATCALCGWRDATHHAAEDERRWPSCDYCATPPPPMSLEEAYRVAGVALPRESAKALQRQIVETLVRKPGLTGAELAAEVGYYLPTGKDVAPDEQRQLWAWWQTLRRLGRGSVIRSVQDVPGLPSRYYAVVPGQPIPQGDHPRHLDRAIDLIRERPGLVLAEIAVALHIENAKKLGESLARASREGRVLREKVSRRSGKVWAYFVAEGVT